MKHLFFCVCLLIAVLLLDLPFRSAADTAVCHVVDPAGKPIAGATIYATVADGPVPEIKTLTANKSGDFSIDIGDGPQEGKSCLIDKPGFAPNGGIFVSGDNVFELTQPVSVSGRVVNPFGQGVAGVTVSADFVNTDTTRGNDNPQRYCRLQSGPLASKYTVKTDLKGDYTLTGLPAGSIVPVEINDPRYVTAAVRTLPGSLTAPPLTAVPGTAISGKVVRADGKPTGIVFISPQLVKPNGGIGYMARTVTKPDGTYHLTGLPPGNYTVGVDTDPSGLTPIDWIAPTPVSVTAGVSTPGAAPDLVLTSGGILTGSVLDAVTKNPIANVLVRASEGGGAPNQRMVNAVTAKDGSFTMHVWNGASTFALLGVPSNYAQNSASWQKFTGVEGQTVTLDPVLLQPAPVVSGTLVDDAGNVIPGLTVKAQSDSLVWDSIAPAVTGKNGEFSLHQMSAGTYFLDPGPHWSVVSPKSFVVPLASPLKLVLKKVPLEDLQGSVVDTTGAPVSRADVAFVVAHMNADGNPVGNQVDVATGDDGNYSLFNAPINPSLVLRVGVSKDGFSYRSGGDVSIANGRLVVSPIVMVQINAKVAGVVRNGLGKPVAGAWVSCRNGGLSTLLVQTDAAGHFEWNNLAAGAVDIDAAKGLFYKRVTAQAASAPLNTDIQLPTAAPSALGAPNLPKATALLAQDLNDFVSADKNIDGTRARDRAAHIIAQISPDAAVNFILASSSVSTDDLEFILSPGLATDPIAAAKWASAPVQRMSGSDGRGRIAAIIGLAVAPYDASSALAYYNIAAQNVHFDNPNGGAIDTAMKLTALAYALHRPEADDDYKKVDAEYQTVVNGAVGGPAAASNNSWISINLVLSLAMGNTKLAEARMKALSPKDYDTVFPMVVEELAKPNPSGALEVYYSADNMKTDVRLQFADDRALCSIVPILYKTNPADALTVARKIGGLKYCAQALTEVADLMPVATAAPIYTEAENTSEFQQNREGYTPACVAHHAWIRDKALGIKLYKIALDKFEQTFNSNTQPWMGQPLSEFAFYYASIDPAYSRLIIERQFAYNLAGSTNSGEFRSECAAMASIDIDRANAMVKSVQNPSERYDAGLKVAQYLLFTPQQRETLPYLYWVGESDWTPGAIAQY